ncbi:hypothetical protein Lepto7375DRAFT_1700 [Leptolyngbya sp. PCC 7375]|nr:hypothetical protein Lepto7375DRAFT_1700 [Leptolyngbya sp. PCC 7375]
MEGMIDAFKAVQKYSLLQRLMLVVAIGHRSAIHATHTPQFSVSNLGY